MKKRVLLFLLIVISFSAVVPAVLAPNWNGIHIIRLENKPAPLSVIYAQEREAILAFYAKNGTLIGEHRPDEYQPVNVEVEGSLVFLGRVSLFGGEYCFPSKFTRNISPYYPKDYKKIFFIWNESIYSYTASNGKLGKWTEKSVGGYDYDKLNALAAELKEGNYSWIDRNGGLYPNNDGTIVAYTSDRRSFSETGSPGFTDIWLSQNGSETLIVEKARIIGWYDDSLLFIEHENGYIGMYPPDGNVCFLPESRGTELIGGYLAGLGYAGHEMWDFYDLRTHKNISVPVPTAETRPGPCLAVYNGVAVADACALYSFERYLVCIDIQKGTAAQINMPEIDYVGLTIDGMLSENLVVLTFERYDTYAYKQTEILDIKKGVFIE